MAPRVVPRPVHERTTSDTVTDAVGLGVTAAVLGHGQSFWHKAAFVASAGLVRLGAKSGAKKTNEHEGAISRHVS